MQDNYLKLKNAIEECNNIVVFSGAGLSTNSGIPDFRSASGIYNQKLNSTFSPEEVVSHTFFMRYPEEFYKFYFDKMVYLDAKPNSAHKYFGKLEKLGKVKAVVTQNIDNLHQLGGSKNVIELHGSIMRNYCMNCHTFYDLNSIYTKEHKVPKCKICGGTIKPDVVLYEEGLDEKTITDAIRYISNAEMLIVVGTSLMVYPAAGFLRYFKGKYLVLINKSSTSYDSNADILINDDIKNVIDYLEK